MKKYLTSLVLAVAVIGCATTQQRVAYNTVSTVEATASAAVDVYYTAVIKGLARTNEVPTVSQKFNQLQAACTLAAATSAAGTNAMATDQITVQLVDLTSFIATLVPNK